VISIGIKELLESGVHFGHQTRKWNPKMKRFIFEARNGIHIIDLGQTAKLLEEACDFLYKTAAKGGKILFVGTKMQAQEAVKEATQACGQFYVVERWLGGTLTNIQTIRKSINRLIQIEKMEADGSILSYGKKEQASLRRELTKLHKNLDGIRGMDGLPDALFVIDIKREHNAVAEARKLKIPIVAIVDTNCDPDLVDYPIPGNDDAVKSIRTVLGCVVQAIAKGFAEYQAKYGRQQQPKPEPAKVTEPTAQVQVTAIPDQASSGSQTSADMASSN
jgi:small subunit ribosomal protein S2